MWEVRGSSVPGGEGVFDVVGGGVDEHPTLVPGPALHPDVLVDVAQALQLAVADHDGCAGDRGENTFDRSRATPCFVTFGL